MGEQVVGVSPKLLRRRRRDKKSRVEQRRTQVFGCAAHQQGETYCDPVDDLAHDRITQLNLG